MLLDWVREVGACLGGVVVQESGCQGSRLKFGAHRINDAAHVFELAVVSPFGRDLKIIHITVGNVRWVTCIHRRNGLGDHLLRRVKRQVNLDLRILRFKFLDGSVQRIVFGFVKTFAPPDGEFFLRLRSARRHQRRGHAGGSGQQFKFHESVSFKDGWRGKISSGKNNGSQIVLKKLSSSFKPQRGFIDQGQPAPR